MLHSSVRLACLGWLLVSLGCGGDPPLIRPSLNVVTPAVGPTGGGIRVTLDGENFMPGATVTFAGLAATEVTTVSPTRIAVTLPALPGAWGKIGVRVQNPDGAEAQRSDLFRYRRDTLIFEEQAPFGSGFGPSGGLLVDLNGDGNLDAVFADRGTTRHISQIHAHLGDGHGGFGPSLISEVGPAPTKVVTGDFNRDGNADLAVTNSHSGNVSVLLGTGQGSFRDISHIKVAMYPEDIVAADLNQDGNDDLLVSSYWDWGVRLLLGDGKGGFSPPALLPNAYGSFSIAVADVDGDSRLDLVGSQIGAQRSLNLLSAVGSPQPGLPTNLPTLDYPLMIKAGDLNGDGWPDLISGPETGKTLSVFLNDGRGRFGLPYGYPLLSGSYFSEIVDLNGDGIGEVIVAASRKTTIYPGLGRGFLGDPIELSADLDVGSLSVGDVDADGDPDLVLGMIGNSLVVFLNRSI